MNDARELIVETGPVGSSTQEELMARYQKVLWHHDFPDEPVELYSEIDAGYEVRKVEAYRDGRRDYADSSRSTGTTTLGEDIVPTIEEINQDPEFSASAITAEEFAKVWKDSIA